MTAAWPWLFSVQVEASTEQKKEATQEYRRAAREAARKEPQALQQAYAQTEKMFATIQKRSWNTDVPDRQCRESVGTLWVLKRRSASAPPRCPYLSEMSSSPPTARTFSARTGLTPLSGRLLRMHPGSHLVDR